MKNCTTCFYYKVNNGYEETCLVCLESVPNQDFIENYNLRCDQHKFIDDKNESFVISDDFI
jgi:hypothetical protein